MPLRVPTAKPQLATSLPAFTSPETSTRTTSLTLPIKAFSTAFGSTSTDANYSLLADTNRDGTIDVQDSAALLSAFGFIANQEPMPLRDSLIARQGETIQIPLQEFFDDSDGLSFSIFSNDSKLLAYIDTIEQQLVIEAPLDFSDTATLVLKADDGVFATDPLLIDVLPSSTELVRLRPSIDRGSLQLGEAIAVNVIAEYSDGTTSEIDANRVSFTSTNPGVLQVVNRYVQGISDGFAAVVGSAEGHTLVSTWLVGQPDNLELLSTAILNVSVYPHSVILPPAESRSLVLSLADGRLELDGGASGFAPMFISHDEQVATVDSAGNIFAQNPGNTVVSVIYGAGLKNVSVQVSNAISSGSQVDHHGGVVAGTTGGWVNIANGILETPTNVSLEPVDISSLPDAPPDALVGAAFTLDLGTERLSAPVQLAYPVQGIAPGSTVYFLRAENIQTPTGESISIWNQAEFGVVGTDGIARTSSPPAYGIEESGSYIVWLPSEPGEAVAIDLTILRGDFSNADFGIVATPTFSPTAGIAAGFLGAFGINQYTLFLPPRETQFDVWVKHDGIVEKLASSVFNPVGNPRVEFVIDGDPEFQSVDRGVPVITGVKLETVEDSVRPQVVVTGNNFFVPSSDGFAEVFPLDVEVRITAGQSDTLGSTETFTSGIRDVVLTAHDLTIDYVNRPNEIRFKLPEHMFAGNLTIRVARPVRTLSNPKASDPLAHLESKPFLLSLESNYTFAAATQAGQLLVAQRAVVSDVEEIAELPVSPLGSRPLTTMVTPDRTRVYVSLSNPTGLAVFDAVALSQLDADGDPLADSDLDGETGLDVITLPVGSRIDRFTIDPRGEYLYAGDQLLESIYVIDIRDNSPHYNQVVYTISVDDAPYGFRGMAVTADGKTLVAAAPGHPLNQTYQGPGHIYLVDLQIKEFPGLPDAQGKPTKILRPAWQVVSIATVGPEPYAVVATSDPNIVLFTDRRTEGLGYNILRRDIRGNWSVDSYPTTLGERKALGPELNFLDPLDVENVNDIELIPGRTDYAFVSGFNAKYVGDPLVRPGGNIGVLADPLGLTPEGPHLIAATEQILASFPDNLAISPDSQTLFVTFQGTKELKAYDVNSIFEVIERASQVGYSLDTRPLELAALELFETPAGILVDRVESTPKGSIRGADALGESLSLTSPVNAFVNELNPTLTWNTGVPNSVSKVYVSTFAAGNGLFPQDLGITDLNPYRIVSGVEVVADAFGIASYKLPASLRLTAGQTYYWGVEASSAGGRLSHRTAVFHTNPLVKNSDDSFNTVTLVTHGFTPDPYSWFTDNALERAPDAFIDIAKLIALNGGDGVVMVYNRQSGNFVSLDGRTPAPGRPLVLVADWIKESTINDSGFSEAAADAMFASLVKLDQTLGGKVLKSPLHFIGHSRGTVVNSEIIQRLGTYYPEIKNIQMTTLDPHDVPQASLDVRTSSLLKAISAIAGEDLGVCDASDPGRFSCWAQGLVQKLTGASVVQGALDQFLERVQLSWLHYADFRDPIVQVWENVAFADNYYQQLGTLGQSLTPNGYSIPGASINLLLHDEVHTQVVNGRAGFTQDDLIGTSIATTTGFGGFAGPHSRVWKWYAGTIDVSLEEFENERIWRRLFDAEYEKTLSDQVLPVDYNETPWYQALEGSNFVGPLAQKVSEGIGTGWFFSEIGGGRDYRSSVKGSAPVSYDNTLPDDYADTSVRDAVPGLFNGDFELGTLFLGRYNHSERKFVGPEQRFPVLNYAVPGWSFHNGSPDATPDEAKYLSFDENSGNYSIRLNGANSRISHNRFFATDNVLHFDLQPVQQAGTLLVTARANNNTFWSTSIDLSSLALGATTEITRAIPLSADIRVIDSLDFEITGGEVLLDNVGFGSHLVVTDSDGPADDGLVFLDTDESADGAGEEVTEKDSFLIRDDYLQADQRWDGRAIVLREPQLLKSINIRTLDGTITIDVRTYDSLLASRAAPIVLVTSQTDVQAVRAHLPSFKITPHIVVLPEIGQRMNVESSGFVQVRATMVAEAPLLASHANSILPQLAVAELAAATIDLVFLKTDTSSQPAGKTQQFSTSRVSFLKLYDHDSTPADNIIEFLPVQYRSGQSYVSNIIVGIHPLSSPVLRESGIYVGFSAETSPGSTAASGPFKKTASGANNSPDILSDDFRGYATYSIDYQPTSTLARDEQIIRFFVRNPVSGDWEDIDTSQETKLRAKAAVDSTLYWDKAALLATIDAIRLKGSDLSSRRAIEFFDHAADPASNDPLIGRQQLLDGIEEGLKHTQNLSKLGWVSGFDPYNDGTIRIVDSSTLAASGISRLVSYKPDAFQDPSDTTYAPDKFNGTLGVAIPGIDANSYLRLGGSPGTPSDPWDLAKKHPWEQVYALSSALAAKNSNSVDIEIYLGELLNAYFKKYALKTVEPPSVPDATWYQFGIKLGEIIIHEHLHTLGLLDRYTESVLDTIIAENGVASPSNDTRAKWRASGQYVFGNTPVDYGIMNGNSSIGENEPRVLFEEEAALLALKLSSSTSVIADAIEALNPRRMVTQSGADVANISPASFLTDWYMNSVEFTSYAYPGFQNITTGVVRTIASFAVPAGSNIRAATAPNLNGIENAESSTGVTVDTRSVFASAANASPNTNIRYEFGYASVESATLAGTPIDPEQGILAGTTSPLLINFASTGQASDSILFRTSAQNKWLHSKQSLISVPASQLQVGDNAVTVAGFSDGVRVSTGSVNIPVYDEVNLAFYLENQAGNRVDASTMRLLTDTSLAGTRFIVEALGVPNEAAYSQLIEFKIEGRNENLSLQPIPGNPNDGVLQWSISTLPDLDAGDHSFALYLGNTQISDSEEVKFIDLPSWIASSSTTVGFNASLLQYQFSTTIPSQAQFQVGNESLPEIVRELFGSDAASYLEFGIRADVIIPVSQSLYPRLTPNEARLGLKVLGSELVNIREPLQLSGFASKVVLDVETLLPIGGQINVGPFQFDELELTTDAVTLIENTQIINVLGAPIPISSELVAELKVLLNGEWSAGMELIAIDNRVELLPSGTYLRIKANNTGLARIQAEAGIPIVASLQAGFQIDAQQLMDFDVHFGAALSNGNVEQVSIDAGTSWSSFEMCGTFAAGARIVFFKNSADDIRLGPYALHPDGEKLTLFGTVPGSQLAATCSFVNPGFLAPPKIEVAEGSTAEVIEVLLSQRLGLSAEEAANARILVETVEKVGRFVQNPAQISKDFVARNTPEIIQDIQNISQPVLKLEPGLYIIDDNEYEPQPESFVIRVSIEGIPERLRPDPFEIEIVIIDNDPAPEGEFVGPLLPRVSTSQPDGEQQSQPRALTSEIVQQMTQQAILHWQGVAQIGRVPNITTTVDDLPGSILAQAFISGGPSLTDGASIVIDGDAAGGNWFVDSTPRRNEEFMQGERPWIYELMPPYSAANTYDLWTVLLHEVGHVLGLSAQNTDLLSLVSYQEGLPVLVTDEQSFTLDEDLDHLSSTSHPYALLAGSLSPGVRNTVSPDEAKLFGWLQVQWASPLADTSTSNSSNIEGNAEIGFVPILERARNNPPSPGAPLRNRDFSNTDINSVGFAWNSTGGLNLLAKTAILSETELMISDLSQTFTVPTDTRRLGFTLSQVDLGDNRGLFPGDAFEVALLNSTSTTSLVGEMQGLTGSDALLSVQADGRVFFAPEVVIEGVNSGDIVDLSKPLDVTIDFANVEPETMATLYFDLIGFGDDSSAVTVSNLVIESTLSWHNREFPEDTSGNGIVTPIDVLLAINELNGRKILREESNVLPKINDSVGPPPYYDVNDDGFLTPIDVLLVVNYINSAGEGEVANSSLSNSLQAIDVINELNRIAMDDWGVTQDSAGEIRARDVAFETEYFDEFDTGPFEFENAWMEDDSFLEQVAGNQQTPAVDALWESAAWED
ncbi:MAG: dockerin type I domain-containing protein [Pirellulaceae bacterium]